MQSFVAGIVLYNPEINRLLENINSIVSQVDQLVLVDNNSNNIEVILEKLKSIKKIVVIRNEKNLGIAMALNQIVKHANQNKYKWVLTLDQDSVAPNNMILEYSKYIEIENVAVICPLTKDRNKKKEDSEDFKGNFKFVDWCITSGSLINVPSCLKIGAFDSKMFIDLVDYEYSLRLKNNGYKIIRCKDVVLLHQLGDIEMRTFIKYSIEVTNHTSLRKYYYSRNSIYICFKYKRLKIIFERITKLIKLFIKVVLYENKKIEKIKALLTGIKDGFMLTIEN